MELPPMTELPMISRSIVMSHMKARYYRRAFAPASALKGKYNFYTKTIELRAM